MRIIMSKFSKFAKKGKMFLGQFDISAQLTFTRNFRPCEYKRMGDLLYFFLYIIDGKEHVGKVGKTVNWHTRESTYLKPSDPTTMVILREATLRNITAIKVYAMPINRIKNAITSEFTGIEYVVHTSNLIEQEKKYIKEAIDAGETLIFNIQKK